MVRGRRRRPLSTTRALVIDPGLPISSSSPLESYAKLPTSVPRVPKKESEMPRASGEDPATKDSNYWVSSYARTTLGRGSQEVEDIGLRIILNEKIPEEIQNHLRQCLGDVLIQ